MRITNKRIMYDLLTRGRFGNFVRIWESVAAVEASGYRGLVSMRSKDVSNPIKLYHVPAAELRSRFASLPPEKVRSGVIFNEAPDDCGRLIQGEYDGYHFDHTFARYPMRIALEKQRISATGLRAKGILRHYLDPGDYDWLHELLDDFPGATIEFSAFAKPVGMLHRRMVVWEVRHY